MTAPAAPSEAKTLLEFIIDLLTDADARAAFLEDPEAALEAAGLEDITVDELQELLPFLLERLDPQRAAHYERHCDDDKPARDACDDEGVRYVAYHRESAEHSYTWKPQRHDDSDYHRPSPHHHDVEIAKVVTHLNFVVNNYSFDSHDTIFNTTNTTVVWAKDSYVRVDNETVNQNAEDGGVVVGRDNNAPIVTGDESFVGDGNQTAGGDAAFGEGSVVKDNELGNGAALANGGDANAVDNSQTAVNFGSGAAATGNGAAAVDNSDNSVTTDASINNSGNTTGSNNGNGDNRDNDQSTDIRDSGNDNSTNFADSFNDNSNQGNGNGNNRDNDQSTNDSNNVDVRDSGNDNSDNSTNDSNNDNGNNRDNDQSVNDSGNDNSDNSVVIRDSVTGNGSSGDTNQAGLINTNTGPLLSGNDTDIPVDVDIEVPVLP